MVSERMSSIYNGPGCHANSHLIMIKTKKTSFVTVNDGHSKHRIPYHAEIRWSHDHFPGSPESKLYREFSWRVLPFLQESSHGP
jgi:hypothetical protein